MLKRSFLFAILVTLSGCSGTAAKKPNNINVTPSVWKSFSTNKKKKLNVWQPLTSAHRRNPTLEVALVKALVSDSKLKETYHLLKRNTIIIGPNSCKNMALVPIEGNENSEHRSLEICYLEDMLYLDPDPKQERYDLGTYNIQLNAQVKRGIQICNVDTFGKIKLNQACVTIQRYDLPVSVDDVLKAKPAQAKPGIAELDQQEAEAKASFVQDSQNPL